MSNGNDGGRTALAGYLYQIVGVLGMEARVNCQNASSDTSELEALLTIARNGELHHEYLDQDAVIQQFGIDNNDECVLVQFKFSRQPKPPTIGPSELIRIIDRLNRANSQANTLDLNVRYCTLQMRIS